jgi:glycosyltransferase involved in cell wall biosynthesis
MNRLDVAPVPSPPGAALAPAAARPTVALVHDYLTQRGGAERVVLAMLEAFPGAYVHTSLYEPGETFPEFEQVRVVPSSLNKVRPLRRSHRAALPVLAKTFGAMAVDADVALCSSSGWAHGARARGRKIVYCHNPARWLYQADQYLEKRRSPVGGVLAGLRRPLQAWDRRAAATADRYLVNSTVVRDRVRAAYGIDAEILPPPPAMHPLGEYEPVAGLDEGFILCVSRLMRYKNVEAVVEAFRGSDDRLVVVGTGPLERELRATCPDNVELVGGVSDPQLRWLYLQSSALVAASHEDYGLTPLEAASFGKPVAALRWGGFLDTVVEGVTGVFFDEPAPESIRRGLDELQATAWNEVSLRTHARAYSLDRFVARLREVVAEEAGLL